MRLTPKQASVVANLVTQRTGEAVTLSRGLGRDIVVACSGGDKYIVGGRGALKSAS
jgi:hypothetical protein